MIFDNYWKKRALKAERKIRYAESSAKLSEAFRQEQKGALAELSERDRYQAIAVETLQDENRRLAAQHKADMDRQDALAREIEDQAATIDALRSAVKLLQASRGRKAAEIGQEAGGAA